MNDKAATRSNDPVGVPDELIAILPPRDHSHGAKQADAVIR